MAQGELLSLSQAAERYHVPVTTLKHAIQRGDITGRKIGSQWVVAAGSVEAFLANRPRRGRPTKNRE
jgi:hypothetical protein